jgi:hypothetical protein
MFCNMHRVFFKDNPPKMCTFFFPGKFSILGNYAKNILPYVENAPIDIKLTLSRRIFEQNPKQFRFLNAFLNNKKWA